ncbi:hypothetical protein [Marinoscillum sp. MHG1-6]|uniref:hypothetical protein n=1 Tax=Marinoscillum sp. MHG1-6 TaxID=2959627 RepID=UPI0021574B4F|nr:hypothetical protein [Marinoscillum sp. MHG1-6]
MRKSFYFTAIVALLTSCYPKIELENFDDLAWRQPLKPCDSAKLVLAKAVVDQQDKILSKGQAEVKGLLGNPDEHELYTRNEKFFYYNLTMSDSCGKAQSAKRLSIRFDALDRAKEVMIIKW